MLSGEFDHVSETLEKFEDQFRTLENQNASILAMLSDMKTSAPVNVPKPVSLPPMPSSVLSLQNLSFESILPPPKALPDHSQPHEEEK